jgi:GDP/UDP-N,N'-diacetylbacillosamine 2-epimerase (hydrolysing)
MKRKIGVITGTRAEYGLLRRLLMQIGQCDDLELQLIVTGMHLSAEFGSTYNEIENDGFAIDRKVEMLLSTDTDTGIAKSVAVGLMGMTEALTSLRPDVMVVLGDRFEVFAAAAAAMFLGIPIAHLHGGETTEGAFDEAIRHAVTKMAHLHFVAAEDYRRRVIQLGEDPSRVFLVGGLGVDAIKHMDLLDRAALEKALDFRLGRKKLMITFHPVTLEAGSSGQQMDELLAALEQLQDTHLIFTMPNADTGGREIARQIETFTSSHDNARCYASLGQLRYLSCLKYVDGVVGNSSSGLTEAPSLRIGTVNIGDRQRGRLKAASIIDCAPKRDEISKAIARLYTPQYQELLANVKNPYGDGDAVEKIVEVLRTYPLAGILKKTFYLVSNPN